ncbi:MAG: glycosyltransferase [Thermoplasmata archaeon]|nr:glycosyltransferase [Thermoplasmata archaeon]
MVRITTFVPLPPTYRGGTEEYAYQVARGLSESVPVRILTTRVRWDPTASPVPTGRAELATLPAFELFERPVVHGRQAMHEVERSVADSSLLHLHMPFPTVERPLAVRAKAAGVPLVLTYHMDAHIGRPAISRFVEGAYRATSAHPALDRASVVVSNSLGYARDSPVLSRHLAKVRVIRKGVDPDRLGLSRAPTDPSPAAAPLPETWRAATGRRVLFVGRLVPYKGLPVLLRGFARFLEQGGEPTTLFLAGRGPQEQRLRSLVNELSLADKVVLLGFVPDLLLGPLYRQADVAACTSVSRLESTPTTLEEAAAFGTPVLGSSLPGADESIPSDGVRGILVPPFDVDGIARGLRKLLGQPRPIPPSQIRTWMDVAQEYRALFRELGALGADD